MHSIDLNLLTTLHALLQEESVSRAARRVGLSTPATSHALARARAHTGDPLLVRAGRRMVLTPRAQAMKAEVAEVLARGEAILSPMEEVSVASMSRMFSVRASDYVLDTVGPALDALVTREAPGIALRFTPNGQDDSDALRTGASDLAVGIYAALPPEMRTSKLLSDRFVCVTRKGHRGVGKRMTLERYTTLSHVQIAPRGMPGGAVDDALAARGTSRHVARAVPYFLTALRLVAASDHVLTVSERIAKAFASELSLDIWPMPLAIEDYTLSLVWHPRFDGDAGHGYLRDTFNRAASSAPQRKR